jgi:NDP-sugar pyrophosphorylase family protein
MNIYGFPVDGYWNDLGDPKRYLEAQQAMFSRGVRTLPVHIAPEAVLEDRVAFRPFVSVGPGCLLEHDCFVENSIIWDGVQVRSRASVRNSIIGANMTVEGDCCDKIVTRNGEISIA